MRGPTVGPPECNRFPIYRSAAAHARGRIRFPVLLGFHRVLLEMDVAIHSFDPSDRNELVLTVRTVFLRQFDRTASDVIDHADLFATGRDHVHVLFDPGDPGVRTLGWAADAGLFLHEIDGLLGARSNLVAHVLRHI